MPDPEPEPDPDPDELESPVPGAAAPPEPEVPELVDESPLVLGEALPELSFFLSLLGESVEPGVDVSELDEPVDPPPTALPEPVVPLLEPPVCARTGPATSNIAAMNAISVFIPFFPSEG